MPSIAWFPFAIVVFGGTENAIYFVVVLGAAPSIANGIISGIDHVPPSYVRLGKVMGANSFSLYRHIVLPAALPSYVAGLSQGWAFAWRSLMAGELLVLALGVTSIGASLDFARAVQPHGRGHRLDDRDPGHRHGRRHHLHDHVPHDPETSWPRHRRLRPSPPTRT